jgi:polyhydroxyalkanoate synthase
MTISEDSPDSQARKKLEKSLEAVAALRKAMEQRLAETRTAQQTIEMAPLLPPEPVVEAAPTIVIEPPAPLKEPDVRVEIHVETAPVDYTPPPSEPSAPAPQAEAEVSIEAAPKEEPQQTPPQAEPAPQPKEEAATQEESPIKFDPALWTQIMIHVSEEGQKLIRDYIVRTHDKPIETVPFSSVPVLDSITQMASRFLEDPETYTEAQLASWQNYIDLTRSTLLRLQGLPAQAVAEAASNDKRFKAKDWQTNWMFDFLKQAYLSNVDETRRMVQQGTSDAEAKIAKKIEFYSRLFLDATAPNNFWMTNPEVLRVTVESKGENLIKGLENLLRDLESGNGMLHISMSDYKAFQLGITIATTPGKVVYQNDLMQLIQYAPSTPSVRRVPLLIIPPWINKYYILDLRQKNSFIAYLVAQGYTVFCISWVNPTKRHALTQFEDYMDKGALIALAEVKRLTGEDKANVLGYCIGGTLLACLQAYLAALPEKIPDLPVIASSTYLVTMVDFAQPGDLGVFIDEDQIRLLEDRMARQGFMDAKSMILTFNLLRANDLIWPFVINNYLLGREPFPFDILYWNTDSTNLPAAMQSYYLRKMYMENKLIQPGGLKMKDVPLDLAEIATPSFLLATREDHIAPWRSAYAATQLYKGPVTFVLSGSGHIAGVVNPPEANKYGYWINSECPENPDDWFKDATPHKGSWWPEWMKWLDPYAGESIPPREITESIENAPGSYVKARAV